MTGTTSEPSGARGPSARRRRGAAGGPGLGARLRSACRAGGSRGCGWRGPGGTGRSPRGRRSSGGPGRPAPRETPAGWRGRSRRPGRAAAWSLGRRRRPARAASAVDATAWPPVHAVTGVVAGAATEHLDGVAEAHPLGPHHPVDDRAAGLAGPHAVPEVLRRGDHQRGGVVVVERAAARPGRPRPSSAPPPTGSPARPGPPPSSAARSPRRGCGPRAPPPKNFPCRICHTGCVILAYSCPNDGVITGRKRS